MERVYSSRKFLLTVWAMGLLTVGLFTSKLTGGEWITGISLCLGMYKAAEVVDKHLESRDEKG